MSNLQQYGNRGLILEEPGELNTDIYGLSTATAVFKCPQSNYGLVPAMFSAHPYFGFVRMEKRKIKNTPGFLMISCDYAGLQGTSVPIDELILGGSEEPIETHPRFSYLAGTPSSPINGAIFTDAEGRISTDDSRGIFRGWRATSPLVGVDSYFSPNQITFRRSYVSSYFPNVSLRIGHIESYGLYVGASVQQRGIVFFVQEEWRGGNWNPLIYG